VRREDRAGMPQHLLTDLGEQDAPAGAFDHRLADHALHLAQMLADGGLTEVQRGGRPVKSPTVGDRDEAAQRCDVEDLSHTDEP
jgi:hypothetical protein